MYPQMEIIGQLLDRRYRIVQILSSGAFSQTYLAADTRRPGHPQCVVKQLKHLSNNSIYVKTAHRLFKQEAEILERLGKHEQIPYLLAYFEENDHFYLVEEFVPGYPLVKEIIPGNNWSEDQVISLLQEILEILMFVHKNGVIHRDVNPANLIRRNFDQKLVLIDFGSVKEVNNQLASTQGNIPRTIATGTPTYMPFEQFQGNPQFNSDIYSVGMIAIQALTGLPPAELAKLQNNNHSEPGKIIWRNRVQCSPYLANIIDRMVHPNFHKRYQSTQEVLNALKKLSVTWNDDQTSITKEIYPFTFSPILARILAALFGVGCVLSGIAVFVYWNRPNSSRAQEYYTRGLEQSRKGDHLAAISAFDRSLELFPNNSEAFYGRGNANYDLRQYEQAIKDYTAAIRLDPQHIKAYFHRGIAHFDVKNKAAALDDFNKAIELSPQESDFFYQRGLTYFELQKYQQAIEDYTQVLKLKPDFSKAYYGRGLARSMAKDYRGAIADYTSALKLDPKSSLAFEHRARSHFTLGDYKAAVLDYSSLLQLDPKNGDAYVNRCSAYLNLSDYKAAFQDCTEAIKINNKDSQAYNNRCIAHLHLGDRQNALADCNKALETNPHNSSAYTNRGLIHTIMGNYRDAIADYTAAISLNSNDVQAYTNRAKAYHQLRDYNNAMSDYVQALRLNPNFAAAYYGRGIVRRDLGDKSGAIKDLTKAAKLYLEQGRPGSYKEAQYQIEQIKGNRQQTTGNRE